MRPEAQFESTLARVASLLKCIYVKVPDMIATKARLSSGLPEHRKPFDGVLITPSCVFAVECKIGYAKQREHQIETERRINAVNHNAYFVLRRIEKAKGFSYRIDQRCQPIAEFDNLPDAVKWFIRLGLERS